MFSINGRIIEVTMFPDKTSQVWHLDDMLFRNEHVTIIWKYEHEGEVVQLAQLADLLSRRRVKVSLEMPYLPYGRQDKEVDNNSTFALSVFALLLNTIGFSKVVIHDPHSRRALDLIWSSTAVYPIKQVEEASHDARSDVLCFPDKGAVDKYASMYTFLPYVYGNKIRNSLGAIQSLELVGDVYNKNVLICDDICDAGGTFIKMAKLLKDAGASRVDLFVSHGLFTKGTKVLRDAGIEFIYTKEGYVNEI